MIKYFEQNMVGHDYIVGDIHFAFRKLQAQLDSFFDPEVDRLFSVGDLVDRGPDVDLLEEWLDKVHAVIGNHEHMIVTNDRYNSINNGGGWFYDLPEDDQLRIQAKLAALPLGFEIKTATGKVGVVHADPCSYDWNDFKLNAIATDVVWSRQRINYSDVNPVKNIDLVYVGHTYTEPKMLGNVIFLDNAAWRNDSAFNIQRL